MFGYIECEPFEAFEGRTGALQSVYCRTLQKFKIEYGELER